MCKEQLSFENLEEIDFKQMSKTEKFDYFENQKNILNVELSDICKEISQSYGIKYLTFSVENSKLGDGKIENHTHAVSVSLSSTFAIRIYLKQNLFRIEYRKKLHNFLELSNDVIVKEMKSFSDSMIIDFDYKSKLFFETCKIILHQALEHYEPSEFFGCCGKYEQCSNARKCLHEDLFYAKACYYKRNLEAGHIFYGGNRNID